MVLKLFTAHYSQLIYPIAVQWQTNPHIPYEIFCSETNARAWRKEYLIRYELAQTVTTEYTQSQIMNCEYLFLTTKTKTIMPTEVNCD